MGYLKITALQISLGIYVVELLLFSAFHFMAFLKDFLVSFLSYIYFFIHMSRTHFYFHDIDPDVQQTALISARV